MRGRYRPYAWVLVPLAASCGCNKGGADVDGFMALPSDLGAQLDMAAATDLPGGADAGPDLRLPVSDQIELGKKSSYEVTSPPWFVRVCDIDRDGKLDVLVTGGDLSVLRGRGDGTMRDALITPSGRSWGLDIGDLSRLRTNPRPDSQASLARRPDALSGISPGNPARPQHHGQRVSDGPAPAIASIGAALYSQAGRPQAQRVALYRESTCRFRPVLIC